MFSTDNNINLNEFLKNFSVKKLYSKKLKNQLLALKSVKQFNYKTVNQKLFNFSNKNLLNDYIVMYTINITFSRSNTFLHVTDPAGKLKFFSSAGYLNHKGKTKKSRFTVFKSIFFILDTKLQFLKDKPIALHLKNVGFNKFWIIKKLKIKFFIKSVKIFNSFPFNGCRIKKVRRKKVRKK